MGWLQAGATVLGGLLGSQTGSSSSSGPPAWVRRTARGALDRANTLSRRPYTPYTGERIRGLSDAERLGNANAYTTGQNLSGALERSATSWADTDRSRYINPYMEAAIDPAARKIAEQGALRRNELQSSAVSRGAFGGSRGAILEGANERDTNQNIGDLYATGLASAYESGRGAFQSDQERLMRAGLEAQRGLYEAGGLERGVDQARADVNYADFLESRDWDVNNLQILLQALGQMPGMNQTTSSGSPLAGAVGGALAGSQLAGILFPESGGGGEHSNTGGGY